MKRKLFLAAMFLLLFATNAISLSNQKSSTPNERWEAFQKQQEMQSKSLFKNLYFRSVGPLVMSGRVVDVEPSPKDPYTFYVAYATGGLWKTVNNGLRFKSIFEGQNAVTIGDFVIDPNNPDIIWVGTGEQNSSRSSYAGTGIYKTIDGGKTWKCMGLEDTHHIGRVLIDPKNSNIVFVAALGHLYTENKERGIYRTKDGGKTWEKVLYINSRTGFVDIVINPKNPNVLYAASWEKDRKAWNFVEGGEGSGIYKSSDGGTTWVRLSGGFPHGKYVGRIGLALYDKNPDIVYALVDNQSPRPEKDQEEDAPITPRKLLKMSKEDILSLTNDELGNFIRSIGLHHDYTPEIIREMLAEKEISPEDLITFIRKNNPHAFDPTIIGPEIYRSDDAGKTWRKMNKTYIDNFYSTYGYYFGQIRVAPNDENRIYILGIPLLTSKDGGKHFEWIGGKNVHVDHHALWLDPRFPDHMIDGNDGGLNLTYDGGKSWWKLNTLPVGQFYSVNVDMAKPYNIYGGMQDNGVYKGSSESKPLKTAPWKPIGGGDGMQVQIDPNDFTVYTGSQFGYYFRLDQKTNKRKSITPLPHLFDSPLRYNWETPILLSPHSSNVLYFGTNRLFRSLDRGDTWQAISPDLTSNPKVAGDVPYGTITTISESPLSFGLIYVGTDDGKIHITMDGGVTWKEIDKGLPKGLWCSRVIASRYQKCTAYVSLNGYRNDDFRAYLYRTRNYGRTWESISSNLPDESINVIREDPINPHILYVGTDMGVFVSIDDARHWEILQSGIPIVPVHDLVIHPRDRDLVVGTHGRSIYVMHVMPIQELTPRVMAEKVHLFEIKNIRDQKYRERKPRSWSYPSDTPTVNIYYWLAENGKVDFTVKDKNGNIVKRFNDRGNRGINTYKWDMKLDRDVVLALRKKNAEEKLALIEKKLTEAKKAEKSASDIEKLIIAKKRALRKVESIQKIIDEKKKYRDLPEKEKKLTPVYVSEGEYKIKIQFGTESDSTTLRVLPAKKYSFGKKEREKRNKEWKEKRKIKKLLEDYKK